MKKPFVLFAALLILGGFAQPAFACSEHGKKGKCPDLSAVARTLTEPTILVRTDLKSCIKDENAEPMAGAHLEGFYTEKIAEIHKESLTEAGWKRLNKSDCLKDCSCSVRSKIFEAYPEEMKAKLGAKDFDAKLEKMTDEDYKTCRDKLPKFCSRPAVKSFLKSLKASLK